MDFRRQSLSLCLSLLVPAFALLIPPEALTGPPSQAYGTFRYRFQGSVIRSQISGFAQALYRPCNILAMDLYSSIHRCALSGSTYPRSRHASAPRAHRARPGTYCAAWSAPPRAGVSATGPSCRPVPAHLCAGCRPVYRPGRTEPTSIGSRAGGRARVRCWRGSSVAAVRGRFG